MTCIAKFSFVYKTHFKYFYELFDDCCVLRWSDGRRPEITDSYEYTVSEFFEELEIMKENACNHKIVPGSFEISVYDQQLYDLMKLREEL